MDELKTSVKQLIAQAKRSGLAQASVVALRMAAAFEGETRQALLDLSYKLIAMSEEQCESVAKE